MDKSRIYIIEENRELLDKITKLLELQLMPSMLLLFLKQTNVI